MKRIIVLGPKDMVTEAAEKLSAIYKLPIYDSYVFTSSSLKDKKDGIYTSDTLQYQQAKKMRPNMLVVLYPPRDPSRIKKYKVVNLKGETIRDPDTGAFLDDLPFLTALKKMRYLRHINQSLNYDVVPYEKDNKSSI